ncbi:MAG: hypothetical protein ACPG4X_14665 [Pikeienuella sp.]
MTEAKTAEPATEKSERGPRENKRQETGRRQRVPMGTPQAKLSATVEEGYVGRWINDQGGRIIKAREAGYEFAEDQTANGEDKRRKAQVGTLPDGSPMFAYLMKIRREFYDEDQAFKQKVNDEVDATIKEGVPQGAEEQDRAGFYVPDEGITMKSET